MYTQMGRFFLCTEPSHLSQRNAIQENGTDSLDYFAMLRGWEMCRNDALV